MVDGDEREQSMAQWRGTDLVRLAAGTADLVMTTAMASAQLGGPPERRDLVIYRVLGTRQVLQAWVTAGSDLRALGAVVDLLHVATMLPVVLLSRRWRRAAALQAGFSAALAVAGLRAR
ncbi:MAG: hypothetical protein QOC59_1756 [Microbacteriaceae bacterium]|jgi:hypothetical protein|nr:hypothetical protein [Microbacteriaceae bacterium]